MSFKEKIKIAGGIFGLSISYIAYFLLGGLGLLIHLLTMLMAWHFKGFIAAVLSLSFPVIAQIYWVIYLWRETGIFFTPYTTLITVYMGIWMLLIIAGGVVFLYLHFTDK